MSRGEHCIRIRPQLDHVCIVTMASSSVAEGRTPPSLLCLRHGRNLCPSYHNRARPSTTRVVHHSLPAATDCCHAALPSTTQSSCRLLSRHTAPRPYILSLARLAESLSGSLPARRLFLSALPSTSCIGHATRLLSPSPFSTSRGNSHRTKCAGGPLKSYTSQGQ